MSIETKCKCQHCDSLIAFPCDMAGQEAVCPHCKMETTLFIPANQVHPATHPVGNPDLKEGASRGVVVWLCIFAVLSVPAYVAFHFKKAADDAVEENKVIGILPKLPENVRQAESEAEGRAKAESEAAEQEAKINVLNQEVESLERSIEAPQKIVESFDDSLLDMREEFVRQQDLAQAAGQTSQEAHAAKIEELRTELALTDRAKEAARIVARVRRQVAIDKEEIAEFGRDPAEKAMRAAEFREWLRKFDEDAESTDQGIDTP
jgi:hypothetical protein